MGEWYGFWHACDISLKRNRLISIKNILYFKFTKPYELVYRAEYRKLFMLYDTWETLNMTQLEYLDQLQQLLMMRYSWKILKLNNIDMKLLHQIKIGLSLSVCFFFVLGLHIQTWDAVQHLRQLKPATCPSSQIIKDKPGDCPIYDETR